MPLTQRLIRTKQLNTLTRTLKTQKNPIRSALYIPSSNKRALQKAQTLNPDAILFDLEDAVAPQSKPSARSNLLYALKELEYKEHISKIVRINGLDSIWGLDDVSSIILDSDVVLDGIALPKTNSIKDVDQLSNLLSQHSHPIDIWTMIETPLGVLNSQEIASHDQVKGFILGTNDLAKELNCTSRSALHTSLQLSLLSAKAYNKVCIDGVYISYKDTEGLRKECNQAKELGFDGKSIIHPCQIDVVNGVFYPSEEEIVLARRHIEAYEDAVGKGDGIAVVDGCIVENLHVERARRVLGIVDAIR